MNANRETLQYTIKQMISVAIVIALAIVLFNLYRYFQPKQPTKIDSNTPSVIADDVHVTQFDTKGHLYYQFSSAHTEHYPSDNHTDFTKPIGDLFEAKQSPWHLVADKGTALQGDKIVHLVGNIIMHQKASKNNKAITLKTSELFIYPDTKTASNDVYTQIDQTGLTVSAIGVQADFKKGSVVLLSQAKGTYQK